MKPPIPGGEFWSRRRWLARLSFSFLIIAAFLVYAAYRGSQTHVIGQGRAMLYYLGALLFSFVLFLLGTPAKRHRRAR